MRGKCRVLTIQVIQAVIKRSSAALRISHAFKLLANIQSVAAHGGLARGCSPYAILTRRIIAHMLEQVQTLTWLLSLCTKSKADSTHQYRRSKDGSKLSDGHLHRWSERRKICPMVGLAHKHNKPDEAAHDHGGVKSRDPPALDEQRAHAFKTWRNVPSVEYLHDSGH